MNSQSVTKPECKEKDHHNVTLRHYIPPKKFGCQVPNWTHKYTHTLPMMVPQCMDE